MSILKADGKEAVTFKTSFSEKTGELVVKALYAKSDDIGGNVGYIYIHREGIYSLIVSRLKHYIAGGFNGVIYYIDLKNPHNETVIRSLADLSWKFSKAWSDWLTYKTKEQVKSHNAVFTPKAPPVVTEDLGIVVKPDYHGYTQTIRLSGNPKHLTTAETLFESAIAAVKNQYIDAVKLGAKDIEIKLEINNYNKDLTRRWR